MILNVISVSVIIDKNNGFFDLKKFSADKNNSVPVIWIYLCQKLLQNEKQDNCQHYFTDNRINFLHLDASVAFRCDSGGNK
jgi:hypothetical protein